MNCWFMVADMRRLLFALRLPFYYTKSINRPSFERFLSDVFLCFSWFCLGRCVSRLALPLLADFCAAFLGCGFWSLPPTSPTLVVSPCSLEQFRHAWRRLRTIFQINSTFFSVDTRLLRVVATNIGNHGHSTGGAVLPEQRAGM